jgi:hypothetical protein
VKTTRTKQGKGFLESIFQENLFLKAVQAAFAAVQVMGGGGGHSL